MALPDEPEPAPWRMDLVVESLGAERAERAADEVGGWGIGS